MHEETEVSESPSAHFLAPLTSIEYYYRIKRLLFTNKQTFQMKAPRFANLFCKQNSEKNLFIDV